MSKYKTVKLDTPKKILVLEDDSDFGILLLGSLKEAGYDVTLFTNVPDALAFIENYQIDLVIADLLIEEQEGKLATHGGITLISKLKQIMNHPAPVIAMSGSFNDDHFHTISSAKTVGADRTIAKPVAPEHLLEVVEGLLELA